MGQWRDISHVCVCVCAVLVTCEDGAWLEHLPPHLHHHIHTRLSPIGRRGSGGVSARPRACHGLCDMCLVRTSCSTLSTLLLPTPCRATKSSTHS